VNLVKPVFRYRGCRPARQVLEVAFFHAVETVKDPPVPGWPLAIYLGRLWSI
jgi:hypothetical protein